jgi:hypothetical protein
VDRSELDRRTKRILTISEELATLYNQTQPALSIGSIGIWIVSGGLGVAGVALAAPTGGSCPSTKLDRVLCVETFLRDVALFLPFGCNKTRQTYAKSGTKRKSKTARFSE